MTLGDLWVTSLYPPPIHTDFQVSVGFPLGLLDILDRLPYSSPDLRWGLGLVLIGSLLVHAYSSRERVLAGEVSNFTMCPTQPEAHLIEADFESTIENRDERNQLLTGALRNGREECLVLGGKMLLLRFRVGFK